MPLEKLLIKWSDEAIADLRSIYYNLLERNSEETSLKIRSEIFSAPKQIVFPEQFQIDEIYNKYRRVIIRNYKVLYTADDRTIKIATVINCYQDSSKK
ncbi:type II toxin-antitoxin system RelE/ParE family toxin [Flavobacterium subsaxonicum]|uniref:Plasmid stabilization protein n=1 Tax=Flavobacterium subsaxonicum WB 4.1-42 = DSM 21790 TaxID=1121898 RepID=A0A0A2MGL4_9FLAO|nr:type II toxin-antitoxin system RelE/ParE family toxin [Flavobacterium subsaxonicum]KGO91434.1 hypothetical protein Q766_17790 [Flavobacterium subsaxonicum WB 4.1-42 = DSM 21790]